MKLRELLAHVDQIRPNAYTDKEKIDMVNTIEGRIYEGIYKTKEGLDLTFVPFEEGGEERELSVQIPFTDLYVYYLASQIDFYNGDVDRYNDSIVLFHNAWDEFAAWHIANHKPKQTNLHGMIPHGRGWR